MTITDAQLESRVLSPRAWQYYVSVIDRELPPHMADLVTKYNKALHKTRGKTDKVCVELRLNPDLRHAALVLEDRFRAEVDRFTPTGATVTFAFNPGPTHIFLQEP